MEVQASEAVVQLQEAVAEFAGLEARRWLAYGHAHHAALSAVHRLCMRVLECEAAGMSRAEIVAFLEPVREIHRRSPFVARLQEWPRQYPGDFETVEYIMRGENRAAQSTLAWHCEAYSLNFPIAQQHRNKVQHQASQILRALTAADEPRILALACGSCPDFRLVLPFLERTNARIVLNDADPAALDFAEKQLASIAGRCDFIEGNVLTAVRRLAGDFDLVLAGGLFDYLPDRAATFLIRTVTSRLLREGGTFFFTNIARGNVYRPLIEYLGDWFLIERSEDDIEELCAAAGVPSRSVSMRRDETGLALLVELSGRPGSRRRSAQTPQ